VKSGATSVRDVRDLRGVMEREKASIGVFITLREPTAPMKREAAEAGFYQSPWGTRHARVQIVSIADIFQGKIIDMPPSRDDRTVKRARRAKRRERPDTCLLSFMPSTSDPGAGEGGAVDHSGLGLEPPVDPTLGADGRHL